MIKKLLLIAFIATASFQTVNADPAKGQKIYLKKFKKSCGINGAEMATKHSQDEWENIYTEGKLSDEILKACPKLDKSKLKKKYLEDLFDFLYEYANDSGNVPSC